MGRPAACAPRSIHVLAAGSALEAIGQLLVALGALLVALLATLRGRLAELLGGLVHQVGFVGIVGSGGACAVGLHAGVIGARAAGAALAEVFTDHATAAAAVFGAAAPGDVVLVKGSRGIRMELFTEALKRLYGVE